MSCRSRSAHGTSLEAVHAGEHEARRLGVSGVPFFVVNGKVALSGAQPPGLIRHAFELSGELVVDEGAGEFDQATGKKEC